MADESTAGVETRSASKRLDEQLAPLPVHPVETHEDLLNWAIMGVDKFECCEPSPSTRWIIVTSRSGAYFLTNSRNRHLSLLQCFQSTTSCSHPYQYMNGSASTAGKASAIERSLGLTQHIHSVFAVDGHYSAFRIRRPDRSSSTPRPFRSHTPAAASSSCPAAIGRVERRRSPPALRR